MSHLVYVVECQRCRRRRGVNILQGRIEGFPRCCGAEMQLRAETERRVRVDRSPLDDIRDEDVREAS